jgi:hypothetical protein
VSKDSVDSVVLCSLFDVLCMLQTFQLRLLLQRVGLLDDSTDALVTLIRYTIYSPAVSFRKVVILQAVLSYSVCVCACSHLQMLYVVYGLRLELEEYVFAYMDKTVL